MADGQKDSSLTPEQKMERALNPAQRASHQAAQRKFMAQLQDAEKKVPKTKKRAFN